LTHGFSFREPALPVFFEHLWKSSSVPRMTIVRTGLSTTASSMVMIKYFETDGNRSYVGNPSLKVRIVT